MTTPTPPPARVIRRALVAFTDEVENRSGHKRRIGETAIADDWGPPYSDKFVTVRWGDSWDGGLLMDVPVSAMRFIRWAKEGEK